MTSTPPNNSYHNSSRRLKKQMKQLIRVAILLAAIVAGIRATRNSSDNHTQSSSADTSASIRHYSNLEKARYPDSASVHAIEKSYEGFTLSFNPTNHTPDWVGWELLASEAEGNVARSNRFWVDNDLPGCATNYDYKNSGFDKGHICPAADQKWSDRAMRDCFSMANITPQDHALNAGAWQTLEKKERLWAQRDSAIVIVAGPIYTDADTLRIGETGVRVPSAFFKVLLAPYVETPRAIGFIYPNMTSPGNMEDYAMTVDEVEKITGLDFFSSLPDNIENKVEKTKSFTEWNRR